MPEMFPVGADELDASTTAAAAPIEPSRLRLRKEFLPQFTAGEVFREIGRCKFEQMPPPDARAEAWRFSQPPSLQYKERTNGRTTLSSAQFANFVERSNFVRGPIAASLAFVNERLIAEVQLPENLLAQGVHFEPVDSSLMSHGELAEFFDSQHAALGSEAPLTLNRANFKAGYVLRVPDGVEIEEPFVIYHWSYGRNAGVFPLAGIIAGANSKITVAEFHLSLPTPKQNLLAVSSALVHAGPGATVNRVITQNWSTSGSRAWQIDTLRAERDATVNNVSVNLGGAWARQEIEVQINGTGAAVHPYGLTIANGTQHFDQRTLQIHNASDSASNLLYKNVLLDQARTVFSGLIQVAPGAQRTDAYQTNRNLRLSPNAEAISMPGLEIAANDVKCSHGATNTGIDPSELFYLHARGIPTDIARELLVAGFFEEILEKVPSPAVTAALREIIRQKLTSNPR